MRGYLIRFGRIMIVCLFVLFLGLGNSFAQEEEEDYLMIIETNQEVGDVIHLDVRTGSLTSYGSSVEGAVPYGKDTDYKYKLTAKTIKIKGPVTQLVCTDCKLKSIDTSKNPKLEYLKCKNTGLKNLDLSQNIELKALLCNNNKLSSLDISKNEKLTSLYCENNKIRELDISKNINLVFLYCGHNLLQSLDVSKNIKLHRLCCEFNSLVELKNLEQLKELKLLVCEANSITTLDLSKNLKFRSLRCSDNRINSLKFASNLRELICDNNELKELKIDHCPNLRQLECEYNQLSSIDISKNKDLKDFNCTKNKITEIDCSQNPKLRYFDCSANKISELDVSKNLNLEYLYCRGNNLKNLDLSKNEKLGFLDFNSNQISHMDFSNNKKLKFLVCYNNRIKTKAMNQLVRSISPNAKGRFYPVLFPVDNEGNVCSPQHVKEMEQKSWTVYNTLSQKYKGMTEEQIKKIEAQASPIEAVEKAVLRYYPNPVQGYLYIEGLKAGEEVKVYAIDGILIKAIKAAETPITRINLQGLKQGYYFVKSSKDTFRIYLSNH